MNPITSAIFDCNIYLQLILRSRGAAWACWETIVAGDVVLFVTEYILEEIRALPEHPKLSRMRSVTPERVDGFIQEVLSVASFVEAPPAVFEYPRDPDDAHYVNLAIWTKSLLVVSNDKDLLDLMDDRNPHGKKLRHDHPEFRVLTPPDFLEALRRI